MHHHLRCVSVRQLRWLALARDMYWSVLWAFLETETTKMVRRGSNAWIAMVADCYNIILAYLF